MARIAKSDVYAAFDRAYALIRSADTGHDGRISREEISAKEATLQGTERQLVDMFYRFMDHRDAKRYAKLTGSDADGTLAYTKEHLVAKYDVNHNGLSQSELSKMSHTAQLAVELAQQMKANPEQFQPVIWQ